MKRLVRRNVKLFILTAIEKRNNINIDNSNINNNKLNQIRTIARQIMHKLILLYNSSNELELEFIAAAAAKLQYTNNLHVILIEF